MKLFVVLIFAMMYLVSGESTDARSYPYWTAHHSYRRYHRSYYEKKLFEKETGHPHGWPGHIVDHIIPLACGGADAPSNMQWQTIADAKAKDKWELKQCGK